MNQVQSFDKKNLENLRSEMNELLSKYGASINLSFNVGKMKYDASTVEITVKATVDGMTTTEDLMLERQMRLLNLTKKNQKGQEIVAFRARSWKRPWVYRDLDGRQYVTSDDHIKLMFGPK
jgi:hypothetical protein